MSTNEPPSALIKVDPPSPSSSPSRIRVYGYGYDDRDSTEPTNGSSSPRATSAPVLPQLPQPPLQVHIHCYPSTQCNLQNASGGNFPIPRHTVDNPSPSASLNVSGQILNTLADAALSAAMCSDATGSGILLQGSRNSERDTENLPFPATVVTDDTKRHFKSKIASALLLLVVVGIIVIRILT